MRVWIDQPACVGNGICAEICPEVFELSDGDIAFVRDGARLLPPGPAGALVVPSGFEAAVLEAADECPAGCIYLDEEG
jgi:ferredoxin